VTLPDGLVAAFAPGRRAAVAEAVGIGHINRTVVAVLDDGRRLVLQRVNRRVFADPEALCRNLVLVGAAAAAGGVRTPRLLPAAAGGHLWWDAEGEPWRAYEELPGRVVDPPAGDAVAHAVAAELGRFAAACREIDPDDLAVTIPRFHDLPHRIEALRAAATADPAGRLDGCRADLEACLGSVDAVLGSEPWAAWRELPVRVAHNDAKAANVLLDADGRPAGVLDLDTTMAGTILADVGELVRSATRVRPEDVADAAPVVAGRVAAVTDGFLAGWDEPLDAAEAAALPVAGAVLTIENAVRFLTDHLDGDVYFAVEGPGHNLRRHRAALLQGRALLVSAGLPSPPTRGSP
jgi:N-acetylhexosamine 1-kinase